MLFDSSTIPVLEQVINFTQARHGVLAGNIANIDTPGYRTRDLSPERFQEALKKAIDTRNLPPPLMYSAGSQYPTLDPTPATQGASYSASYPTSAIPQRNNNAFSQESMKEVKESMKSILFHDNSDVSIETQVTELTKNQYQHNLAISIMTSQFRLLRAAITERA